VTADRAFSIILGVLAVIALPFFIAAWICADDYLEAARRRVDRLRDSWHEQRTLERLESAFAPAPPAGPPWAAITRVTAVAVLSVRDSLANFVSRRLTAVGMASAWLPAPASASATPLPSVADDPPFEMVVASLRELQDRRDDVAYDLALQAACRCLSISQHLDEVTGMDLQIERVRVEGALAVAGLTLED
jgi:hypothetical protein